VAVLDEHRHEPAPQRATGPCKEDPHVIDVGPGGDTTNRVITLLAVAVIFGLVNALVRPIVKLLTLPLLLLTLGLFTFVVNALMLLLTSWLSRQLELPFVVDGFVSALFGALIISLVGFAANAVLPDRYES
jgi:putative membrane protein